MSTNSSSSHSTTRSHSWASGSSLIPRPICPDHKTETEFETSNTVDNPFRRYFRCRRTKGFFSCRYFQWSDPSLSEYYKLCIQRLKAQQDQVNESLQFQKRMLSLTSQELTSKNAEIEELKKIKGEEHDLVDDLIAKNVELQVKTRKLTAEKNAAEQKVVIILWVVAVLILIFCTYMFRQVEFDGIRMLM